MPDIMLHMPRQLSCRGMCQIVTWLDLKISIMNSYPFGKWVSAFVESAI